MNDSSSNVSPSAPRIAFIIHGYGLGNSPSLINAAKMLVSSGYIVDFFTCGTFIGNFNFNDPRIRVHRLSEPGDRKDFVSRAIRFVGLKAAWIGSRLPMPRQIQGERHRVGKNVASFVDKVSTLIGGTRYNCFVGVEPLGLMTARELSVLHPAPFLYYSLELHYGPDIVTASEHVMKEVEKAVNPEAAFTITLDRDRAMLMAAENNLKENSILTVPVCADGDPFRDKTDVIRKRLGIGPEKKIVLYAGFLADWAMCEEIAASTRTWPDDWVLVFHTHGRDNPGYITRVRELSGGNVFFSMDPVSYENLAGFLASADIGVALYRDLGVNFTHVGSASGKLAHYLRSGLPVIVNDYPSVSRIIDKYSCGVGIRSTEDLSEAVNRILGNYEAMREGAFLCYQENYRFSEHFQKVIDRIRQLQ